MTLPTWKGKHGLSAELLGDDVFIDAGEHIHATLDDVIALGQWAKAEKLARLADGPVDLAVVRARKRTDMASVTEEDVAAMMADLRRRGELDETMTLEEYREAAIAVGHDDFVELAWRMHVRLKRAKLRSDDPASP